ncbi:histidine phosphatase family protein [Flavobacterium faecale]|uniref:Histidine phosphatase family protein n=1 Tax=Flavobacterium faecale TaxID=1355330 RepID=A0A2S1LE69_9FLAO|nr:histidine phosphatase family protein [Flavobacterium faecale]AWG22034.1 histidine phosphatase family protein [Flavobacterium faecale]
MKNLILIRHGKSNWDVPFKDIDRPLDKKGMQDAHLMSSNICSFIPKTYVFWSSVAKRAADTAIIFSQNLSVPIESIVFKNDLYTFDDSQLEKIIKSCDNSFETLILFGHNGAITDFVNKFGDVFVENVPTAGFVSMQFATDSWKNIADGQIKKIITPKDLKK